MTDEPHGDLGADEHRLDASLPGDEADRRILWLVRNRLRPVGSAHGGWDQLYVDPRDGRYWELTFPHGSLHGGGPRRLAQADPATVREKYPLP